MAQGVPWPSPDCPVLFVDVKGRERQTSAAGHAAPGRSSDSEAEGGGGGGGGGGASYSNPEEAAVAMQALGRVLRDASLQSVAILSPYRWAGAGAGAGSVPGQGWLGRERWDLWSGAGPCPALPHAPPPCRLPCITPCSGQVRVLSSLLSQAEVPERCSVTVSTVDGYQGREADCVIFSAVRW